MLTVPGSMPMTRGICKLMTFMTLIRAPGHFENRLRVEHEIVSLEQLRDARLVKLHLQAADAERPVRLDPVPVDAVVHRLDAFDAERRDGVDVRGGAQPRPLRPCLARDQLDAESAGAQKELAALHHARRLRRVRHRHRA